MALRKEIEIKAFKDDVVDDLNELQRAVKDAIDEGTSTIEKVVTTVIDKPLSFLERIDVVKQPAKDINEVQKKAIGHVSALIRTVNGMVFDISTDIFNRVKSDKKAA